MIAIASEPIFTNAAIDRSLPAEARVEILEAMRARGDARWLDERRERARVVDASDLETLHAALEAHVRRYGLSGRVYTTQEIAREIGTDVERARATVELAESRGACVAFGEDGVKFA